MKTTTSNVVKTLVFLAIGIALLYWAFHKMDMSEVLSALKNANYTWVLAAFLCGVLSHLSRAIRWRYLLEPMGYQVSVKHSFLAVMSGYLMNYIVPRLGEVSRCAMVNRTDKVPFEKLIGTVVVERIVDLLMTALISAAILFTQYDLLAGFISNLTGSTPGYGLIFLAVAILIVLLAVFLLILKNRAALSKNPVMAKLFAFWDGILEGLTSILSLKKVGRFLFHSFFIWTMYFMMSWLVFYSIPGTSMLGIKAGLTVLLAGTLAIIIPVPGGVGTFHTIVPAALLLYGVSEVDGLTYALISHSTQMLMIFLIGGISLFWGGAIARKNLTLLP